MPKFKSPDIQINSVLRSKVNMKHLTLPNSPINGVVAQQISKQRVVAIQNKKQVTKSTCFKSMPFPGPLKASASSTRSRGSTPLAARLRNDFSQVVAAVPAQNLKQNNRYKYQQNHITNSRANNDISETIRINKLF